MKENFDVIVLGVGSMGSAACYYLATRGYSVLGLEQFDIPHELGSHAGQSRIIRKAYFEHSDYVPLLQRAYENWKELEKVTATQVYFPTGLLYAGKPDDGLIKGVRASAGKYYLPIDSFSQKEMYDRFPQFNLPDDYEVLFESDAGFLTPERAILLYVEQAIRAGATIQTKEKVISWKREGGVVSVTTDKNNYQCVKLVITAGPWAGKLIPSFQNRLHVSRQINAWVIPEPWKAFSLGEFPCWVIDDHTKPGLYYGFPVLPPGKFGGPVGLKVVHHYPGSICDPDQMNRMPTLEDEELLTRGLNTYFPGCYSSIHVLKPCLYTNSSDENFILDFLPGYDQDVVMAAGFSGHGFKFASVVGEIMMDLATKGRTNLPIGFLSAQRFDS